MWKTFFGTRGSKAYVALISDQLYDSNVFIAKEECTSHIRKRMGRRWRELVRKSYLSYKTNFCHKVALDAQLMNFFI